MSRKPNILMIVADQWRADSIGYTGCRAAVTPNLDSLAKDGVGFLNAFCQNPVCVPSRCSFLTGFYPHTKGFRTMHNLMKAQEPNLLKSLRHQGYEVFWGGRNDFLNIQEDIYDCCDIRFTQGNHYMKAFKPLPSSSGEGKEVAFREWRMKDMADRGEESSPWYYSMYKGVKEQPGCMDKVTLEECAKFIKTREEERPFFAYLSLFLPHPPYIVEQEYYDRIDGQKVWAPVRLEKGQLERKPSILRGIRRKQKIWELGDEELKEIRKVYLAMGTKLDEYIGKLIETLKEKGIYEDTVIVFMSDHGDYTGDYEVVEKNQNTFEDCLIHVPLIIKPSRGIPVVPRNTPAMTELLDVQATLMEICGAEYDYTQFGSSLMKVLAGKEEHREAVFCEGGRLKEEGWYAMDAGHDRASEYWPRTSEQEQMPQHTKAVMIRTKEYKYVKRLYERDEFYDLTADPEECDNKIECCDLDILSQLKDQLTDFLIGTADVVPHSYDRRS